MSFLITGGGRQGTTYMRNVLCNAGLDVGHERMAANGAVSAGWCINTHQYPGNHQQGPRPHFDVILHQVRHPLDTIASLQAVEFWDWNCEHISATPDDLLLVRASSYWLEFNLKAEAQAVMTYRIEDLEKAWERVWVAISLYDERLRGRRPLYKDVVAGIPTNLNTRKHKPLTWKDIPAGWRGAIRSLARRYGYSV